MKHKDVKECIVSKMGKLVCEEIRALCSDRQNSVMRNTNPQTLRSFECKTVISEMEECAPTLLSILRESTKPPKVQKRSRSQPKRKHTTHQFDRNAIIAMCTAILCKNRRNSMCLLQKIISLILQAGRSSKKVLLEFNLQLVCTLYISSINRSSQGCISLDCALPSKRLCTPLTSWVKILTKE